MKKTLTLLTSAVISASFMFPLSSSAILSVVDGSKMDRPLYENQVICEEDSVLYKTLYSIWGDEINWESVEKIVATYDYVSDNYSMQAYQKFKDYLYIKFLPPETESENIEGEMALASINTDKIRPELDNVLGADAYTVSLGFNSVAVQSDSIDTVSAKQLGVYLKENNVATEAKFVFNQYQEREFLSTLGVYSEDKAAAVSLESYLDSNGIKYESPSNSEKSNYIWCSASDVKLVFNDNASFEDKLAIVEKVYDETGLVPSTGMRELTGIDDSKSSKIEIINFVDGDANNDGELRLNDAVLIMQVVGNPGKYQLDAQQRFNADIYGNGDGLTNMDALTVQRKLIGLE